MPLLESYYQALELEPGASLEEVKRAYRELAQVWHPDRFTGKPHLQERAQEKLKQINEAYRELVRALEREGGRGGKARAGGGEVGGRRRRPGESGTRTGAYGDAWARADAAGPGRGHAGTRPGEDRAEEREHTAGGLEGGDGAPGAGPDPVARAQAMPGEAFGAAEPLGSGVARLDARGGVPLLLAGLVLLLGLIRPLRVACPAAAAALAIFWWARTRAPAPALRVAAAIVLALALALGVSAFLPPPGPSLRPIAGMGNRVLEFRALAVGSDHACGLTGDGRLYCWGANDAGQLGAESVPDRCSGPDGAYPCSAVAQAVGGDLRFREVVVGLDHTCALDRAGAAYCWGAGYAGQLGSGDSVGRSRPVAVEGAWHFRSLATLGQHTCGVDESGAGACWGRDTDGQLGDPRGLERCRLGRLTFSCALSPIPVEEAPAWRQLVTGTSHSCGLAADGAAYCWGSDGSGQLGADAPSLCLDDEGEHPCALRPNEVAGDLRFTTLTAGAAHTCGLARDGRAFCWGRNEVGQLGTGSTRSRDRPTAVQGDVRFARIGAGGFHTCGLTRGGELHCWGHDAFGQLGRGSAQRCGGIPCSTRPLRVRLPTVSAVALGLYGTCAITARGPMCWGRDDSGQLGMGEIREADARVPVAPAPAGMAASSGHGLLPNLLGRARAAFLRVRARVDRDVQGSGRW